VWLSALLLMLGVPNEDEPVDHGRLWQLCHPEVFRAS